jgi:hypothetical protein
VTSAGQSSANPITKDNQDYSGGTRTTEKVQLTSPNTITENNWDRCRGTRNTEKARLIGRYRAAISFGKRHCSRGISRLSSCLRGERRLGMTPTSTPRSPDSTAGGKSRTFRTALGIGQGEAADIKGIPGDEFGTGVDMEFDVTCGGPNPFREEEGWHA